tara:strand:- start:3996 stop:4883 length:888 start_codon:yes stop_codon:yes gene_type:complete
VNWDDIRIFLAVARARTVRGAAIDLKVNHTTVSRRISAFEESINVRLFERVHGGHLLTSAGEDLLKTAQRIEEEVAGADRRIMGKDDRMSGPIRVTFPAALGVQHLIEDFKKFSDLYPDITLELNGAYDLIDLSKREADIAIRAMNNPPENLVGRRIMSINSSVYISKSYWREIQDGDDQSKPTWLGNPYPETLKKQLKSSMFSNTNIKHQINFPEGLIAAVRAGMGIATLPCGMGDADPELMRVPPGDTTAMSELWVLTHNDLRHTLKVKIFIDFISKALLKYKDLYEGRKKDL